MVEQLVEYRKIVKCPECGSEVEVSSEDWGEVKKYQGVCYNHLTPTRVYYTEYPPKDVKSITYTRDVHSAEYY